MLKHVRISNYKSLGDVALDLDPVTVLIGRSGTGKTNFVEALKFLRDYVVYRNDGMVQAGYGGWHQVMSATAPSPMAARSMNTNSRGGRTPPMRLSSPNTFCAISRP